VLRALGFTSGQLKSAVGWHATTIVLVGLVVGVPIGIVGSLILWRAFANQLDVVAEPQSPIALVAVVVALAVLVANAVAIVPARTAGRIQPATLLTSVT
jgi:ABC-type lipoprotein release transport system permease subunit